MNKNLSTIVFIFSLISGTLISISSNSWLGAWMGLEINLLSFIPLMNNSLNLMSTESSLKYFLTQALASSILLCAVIFLFILNELEMFFNNNLMLNLILNSSLLMKMGAAPLHFWFPGVMEGLTWLNGLILMTWQKIAPMLLLSYCLNMNLIYIIIMISIFIGSLGGINQTSLRKLMAYSSINHLGWMLSSFYISNSFWMIYFFMYSFLSLSIISLFMHLNIFYMSQTYTLLNNSPVIKFLVFCNFLSLGGLPPFLGFLPKWLIIQNLITSNLFLISFMTMMTLITLFFYIRISYSAFMLNYSETKWMMKINLNMNFNLHWIIVLNFVSLMGLSLVLFLFYIF
uniref:NADH-ubiquinone oxidoreductase chain 2 n=1 Tax=Nevrorthus apatelios TaxID=1247482 RepID=A0A1S5QY73_9NEOP|nr:NADH dehydrogenase subunit 2 [Nevrorthus apatelios]